jgi:diguanylate cyclase (GGDEF)-like protein
MGLQFMIGQYDYRLVALSVVVAMFASYTALDLAGRVAVARKRAHVWLAGGAFAMGTGIWSMHFVAMLAFKLPIAMGYSFVITTASWLMAVFASAIALYLVSQPLLSLKRIFFGAICMAAGIGGMHYTGMYAMRMQPGIVYDPILVAASLVIAFGASAAALFIAFKLRNAVSLHGVVRKIGAAMVMGVAIAGMHYTGMAAAQFPLGSVCGAASDLDPAWLATLIGVSTLLLLGTTLIASVLDQRLENQTAQLVNSLSKANAELLHLSLHDPLTNLANRALLHDRIGQSLDRWRHDRAHFAVIYVDLDGFKAINDNLGHRVGDELLKTAARAMTETVRHSDIIARMGGDEFVVLVNDLDGPDAVARICAKLLETIARITEGGIQLSASIGSAIYPDDGEDASQLITAADHAMYAAKMAGKNGYQPYRPYMNAPASEEFAIQTELRAAIKNGELVVHYQPKYSAGERRLLGAEALVRWQHRTRGLIPPDRFIYVAERCGLIVDLECWVLESVCAQIRAWLDAGMDVPPISVNLSAVRIRDKHLPEHVQACLDRHGLPARYLVFEITESLAMDDVFQAIRTLARFNEMGVHFALDDFGTGYSSLSYLKQLPLQQLKIDRTFIADMEKGENSQAEIVRSIIGLAHALGLRVVAEGVETEAQMTYLNRFRCDEVQGYLLSRPVPANDFAALIADPSHAMLMPEFAEAELVEEHGVQRKQSAG